MSLENTKYLPIPSTNNIQDVILRRILNVIKINLELLANQTQLEEYSAVLKKDFRIELERIADQIQYIQNTLNNKADKDLSNVGYSDDKYYLKDIVIALSCIG